ncbi:hypothetical protein, partial [Anoxybacillus kestanbolensis]|uniref:hypothetical protein n=1 Tax=Anoxybacillus kestanbolensis TaxID=227476 RepID=UPI003D1C9BDF
IIGFNIPIMAATTMWRTNQWGRRKNYFFSSCLFIIRVHLSFSLLIKVYFLLKNSKKDKKFF